jgi:hypothetical protein
VTGRRFTDAEAHLLTHAAAMGGWLAVSYSRNGYDKAMAALLRDGFFQWAERDGWRRHELTATGLHAAADLGVTP